VKDREICESIPLLRKKKEPLIEFTEDPASAIHTIIASPNVSSITSPEMDVMASITQMTPLDEPLLTHIDPLDAASVMEAVVSSPAPPSRRRRALRAAAEQEKAKPVAREVREPREPREVREPREPREPRESGEGEDRERTSFEMRTPRHTNNTSHTNNTNSLNGSRRTTYNSERDQADSIDDALLGEGILDIMPEGPGFLRHTGLITRTNDIYVAQAQIKRFHLRTGDTVRGYIRPPKDTEKYHSLLKVDTVNGVEPEHLKVRPNFDDLVPIFPNERIVLETESNIKNITGRMIDLVAPIGKGQRGLIVAPPKAGKTIILKALANAITENHPEIHLMICLIDERPEEVTDIQRSVKGEVLHSTFDQLPENHMRVADMTLEKAKRLAEMGKDVVILLDSITRLTRASNLTVNQSGRTLQGGLDPAAIYRPKRFFGAARNIENGGSLTIIASALVETGSRMDEIIFEEFKGTGNMELRLERSLAEQRIYPAIDIKASGTRWDELLYPPDEFRKIRQVEKVLSGLETKEATELLIDRLSRTKSNKAFLDMISQPAKN
jgi:transcription termination factor Rho